MGWKFLQPFQFEDQDDDNKGWAELVASEIYSAKVDVVPIPAGTSLPNFCRCDELSSILSWVDCLLTDSEVFILFSEIAESFSKFLLFPFS